MVIFRALKYMKLKLQSEINFYEYIEISVFMCYSVCVCNI